MNTCHGKKCHGHGSSNASSSRQTFPVLVMFFVQLLQPQQQSLPHHKYSITEAAKLCRGNDSSIDQAHWETMYLRPPTQYGIAQSSTVSLTLYPGLAITSTTLVIQLLMVHPISCLREVPVLGKKKKRKRKWPVSLEYMLNNVD